MHKRLIGFSAAMLAVAAFGCGSSNNRYICNYPAAIGICTEWDSPSALTSTQVSSLQAQCSTSQIGGTFSTGGNCPSASRVGVCTITFPQVPGTTYKLSLYSPNYDAQTGPATCTGQGTWTPG